MFVEKRPTCVTVIGWAWIVIGILGSLAAISAFGGGIADAALEFGYGAIVLTLAIVQIFVCALGAVSGVAFLKLRPWALRSLEGLTWVLLALFAIATAYPIVMTSLAGHVIALGELMIIGVIASVYIAPLVIMLIYLRGDRVRAAFELDTTARSAP